MAKVVFSLTPSEGFRHKLGLGKPIGLGTVKIQSSSVTLVDRIARYTSLSKDASSSQSLSLEQWMQLATRYGDKKSKHGGNDAAKNALRLLGNPTNVELPVHYPQLAGGNLEDRTYQWFVQNDSVRGTGLKSLDGLSSQIPDLPRTPVGKPQVPHRKK